MATTTCTEQNTGAFYVIMRCMTALHMALKISFYKFIYTFSRDNEFGVRAHDMRVFVVLNSMEFFIFH